MPLVAHSLAIGTLGLVDTEGGEGDVRDADR